MSEYNRYGFKKSRSEYYMALEVLGGKATQPEIKAQMHRAGYSQMPGRKVTSALQRLKRNGDIVYLGNSTWEIWNTVTKSKG